ncbi:MAG: radical SAM protein [Candidatus Omnitrophica bacterium]|nr:radical SAM protein [Candidatus Omnitrophota bacterium]
MTRKNFKYIYGPVSSWRLGSSLGIDLLSQDQKLCSFDCIYCQAGPGRRRQLKRILSVATKDVIQEIKALPKVKFDYITFSGKGEPTLAINLGQTIKAVKKIRKEPIAVLTNATLLSEQQVRKELGWADLVVVKLDADSEQLLRLVNRPARKIKFTSILKGIRQFRKEFRGTLALQVMLMQKNIQSTKRIAELAKIIRPDEIQICTPIRPNPIKPLPRKSLLEMKRNFSGIKVVTVYEAKRKKVRPLSRKGILLRRGRILE